MAFGRASAQLKMWDCVWGVIRFKTCSMIDLVGDLHHSHVTMRYRGRGHYDDYPSPGNEANSLARKADPGSSRRAS
ncbi:hypothetical protein TOPH_07657 [Tolypocladium ophioglossoides CBS 100239]|uniref:Uncharacterized protein n=1 Tax=Tolypocladium ophioglossoides (strain CBS 100239) TaxID=1163406 RepID=A0A0L0N0Y7_TOLOC|nr:hypothetical protein TOPH_07657 [Tolypocladium ophioglossoides CBS 100239]